MRHVTRRCGRGRHGARWPRGRAERGGAARASTAWPPGRRRGCVGRRGVRRGSGAARATRREGPACAKRLAQAGPHTAASAQAAARGAGPRARWAEACKATVVLQRTPQPSQAPDPTRLAASARCRERPSPRGARERRAGPPVWAAQAEGDGAGGPPCSGAHARTRSGGHDAAAAQHAGAATRSTRESEPQRVRSARVCPIARRLRLCVRRRARDAGHSVCVLEVTYNVRRLRVSARRVTPATRLHRPALPLPAQLPRPPPHRPHRRRRRLTPRR